MVANQRRRTLFMLERIVTQQVFFYFVGAVIAIGVLAKIIAGISLKRLVKAASNMGKSNHALMKLVRAKFEHACMISDKVQNVRAFVDSIISSSLRLHQISLHTFFLFCIPPRMTSIALISCIIIIIITLGTYPSSFFRQFHLIGWLKIEGVG